MIDKTRPMTLGDIFSTTFSITGKTFFRNLVIAAVFLVPAGLLLGFGLQSFFSNIADFTQNAAEYDNDIKPSQIVKMLAAGILYFFSLFIFMFCYFAALIGITKTSAGEIEGIKISLSEAFGKIFSVTYLRALGLILLILLAMAGIMGFFILIVALTGAIDNWIFKFFGVVTAIVTILFMIYLIFRWYFSFVNIVAAEDGIVESLKKSSFLVKDYWWRTFGIIILISLIVSFASTLISTPFSFLFMWGFISEYMNSLASGDDPAASIKMLKSVGFGYGLTMGLSTLLQALILPVSYVVMYYDLKIRKNDFPSAASEEGNTGEDNTRSWELPVE
ncbi:MAG: hypothetical protein R6W90_01185 [Ignavibacteriaceae bacterium]